VLGAGTWQGSLLSKRCLLSQRGLSELDHHAGFRGGRETGLWLAVGQLCCGDHRITQCSGLGGTSVGHLVQPLKICRLPLRLTTDYFSLLHGFRSSPHTPDWLVFANASMVSCYKRCAAPVGMVARPLGMSAGSRANGRRWRKDGCGLSSSSFLPPWYLPGWRNFLAGFTHELKSTSRAAALGCGYQCVSKDPNHGKGIQALAK